MENINGNNFIVDLCHIWLLGLATIVDSENLNQSNDDDFVVKFATINIRNVKVIKFDENAYS